VSMTSVDLFKFIPSFAPQKHQLAPVNWKRRKWSGAEISAGMFSNVFIHSLAKEPS
jgi:hypothetical protein